ncbi:MAG: U32 family peptidase [Haliscomenobacteraceae bacterium CHB4]|nr:putative protease YdcP [Saprospiraceae bacterium]MCE7924600.1 U32 family peptidase [Haliscomenobacteraceae bacterium CHB4]
MQLPNRVEILAPAGSFESLRAAVQAGADAVYFGVEQLNMRARSSNNFTVADLKKIAVIGRKNSLKTYLTLNTIVYNHDLALMKSIVRTAKECGINAVIAMDHAVIGYAAEVGLPVHLSTQANVTNIEAVKFYARFADLIVLSRELTLSQVAEICRQVAEQDVRGPSGDLVRIEVFAHGALCMAVSGKCYLSLHTHNASANRGACKQNCRRAYTVRDDEGNELKIDNEFIMSPKDLCTIGFLDRVLATGVSVLKIEGRSKGPDYVYETAACYREAAESIHDGSYGPEKVGAWMQRLEKVYNRGFWDGYYLGCELGEWTDAPGSKATERKTFIGLGLNYLGKIKVGEFKLQAGSLKVGDEVMVAGPTTGVARMRVTELRLDDSPVEAVERRGACFSMPSPVKIRSSDKLFKIEPV